jgi:hypothetical protein
MVGAGEQPTRRPTLRWIAIAVIALLAGIVTTAIVYRQAIAQALLMRQLRNLGLAQATFAVGRFDAALLELENLSLGDGLGDGLDIARIEAHFSTRGLFASRLDALQVSGVRLRGTLDEAGLSFGLLDRLFESSETSAAPSSLAALPAAGVEIEDAQLELATAEGPLRASLELQAVEIAPGQLEADAELRVDHALANLDARLSASGSPSSLTGTLELEASAAGELGAHASARAARLTAKAAFSFEAGDIAIQPEGCAQIQIEGLSVKPVLTLSKPLDFCLRSGSESGIRITQAGGIETDLEVAPAAFAARLQIGGKSQPVTGELPLVRIHTSGRGEAFEASLETQDGRLAFAKQAVGVRDIRIAAELSIGGALPEGQFQTEGQVQTKKQFRTKGQVRIGEIFDTQRATRFPKLALKARFAPRDDGVEFEMELADPKRALVIEINGAHDLARAAGRAHLHLRPIVFKPGELQPSTLFPGLSNLLTEVSGSIEMKGSGKWDAAGMRGTAEVAISDAGAKSELASVEHLNAIVELNEKGATLLDQTVSIGRLDFGLELTDGLIRYRLKPGGIVAIESASWRFAGGEFTTTGEIDPQSEKPETVLLVKGVDLARLFELVNLAGLSGSGTLEGEVPLALVGGGVEIRNAVLRSSDAPGVIRYRPASGPSNIAAADDQFATALNVLEDFHYERIEIEINGSATGTVVIQIHLAGANPDYQDGYPVEFNLSVDARLSDLLRSEMHIYQMPKKLEERLQSFRKKTP